MSNQFVDMLDAIHGDLGNVPHSTTVGKMAGYTTGTPDIQWTGTDWEKFPHIRKVRIDQSDSTAPTSGDVKDCENGAATIATAVEWAYRRKALGLPSTIYVNSASLYACEEAAKARGVEPSYWLADWNLNRTQAAEQLGGRIVAIQYASPQTNPDTFVPGTNSTLAEVNCDLSVALADWLPAHKHHHLPHPHAPIIHRRTEAHKPPKRRIFKVHPKVMAGTSGGGIGTALVGVLASAGVHITSAEAAALATFLAALVGWLAPTTFKAAQ